jgi:hypothetical protein
MADAQQQRPWKVLDDAEGEHQPAQRPPREAPATTPQARAKATEEHQQEPLTATSQADAAFLAGVQQAHDKVRVKSTLEAALKSAFIFDNLRPMSYRWPSTWGQPVTRWVYFYKGWPCEALHFANGERVKRSLRPAHGYD